MRSFRTFSLVASTALIAGLSASVFAAGPSSAAVPVPAICNERADGGPLVGYGLTTDQRVICFKVSRPSVNQTLLTAPGKLTAPDTTLVGIDVRPANGQMYAVGDAGGIYELNLDLATPVFRSRINVALQGRSFGLDFNPTVDRLRLVSDTGQNLRINVDNGVAVVDGNLNVVAGTSAPGIAGVAYTNNDNDASTATTLFDLDSVRDQLVTQNPPNNGTIVSGPSLGFDTEATTSFDIWSDIKDGKAIANRGFVALDGGRVLFEVDLSSGALSFIANMGADRLAGLAFATM